MQSWNRDLGARLARAALIRDVLGSGLAILNMDELDYERETFERVLAALCEAYAPPRQMAEPDHSEDGARSG
jgi:hypothetical protein